MNVTVLLDGDDITTSVISYDRDKALCTSVGQLRLETLGSVGGGIYQEVELYEEGIKKGTYFIHTIDNNVPSNTKTFSCQDASLKYQTYWIPEVYQIDYDSYSDYWIKKFLDEATISWVFDGVTTGTLLNNNTSLGSCTAQDAITPLLQQNGWYLSFDADNTAHIGRIEGSPEDYSEELTNDNIISISANAHDKMFRNRVIVWGNTNRRGQWIYTDLNRTGNYENEYDDNDTRSAVIANSNIREQSSANAVALRALEEFEQTNYEITIDYAGAINLDIGEFVYVNSDSIQRVSMVTNIGSSLSANGLITHIITGQRCPRLYAFYDFGGYVYVGTQGAGVWRKPIDTNHTWVNFSDGLTELNIVDLIINDGVYACIGSSGQLFIRTAGNAAWVPFTPSVVDEYGDNSVIPSSEVACKSVTIDKITGDIIAGFSLREENPARSWIYRIRSSSNYTRYQFYDSEDIPGYTIVSLDNSGTSNVVTVVENYSGLVVLNNTANHWSNPNYVEGFPNTVSGFMYGFSGVVVFNNTTLPDSQRPLYIYGDGKYIITKTTENRLSSTATYTGIDAGSNAIWTTANRDLEIGTTVPIGNHQGATVYFDTITGNNVFSSEGEGDTQSITITNPGGDDYFIGAVAKAVTSGGAVTSGVGVCYYAYGVTNTYQSVSVYRWRPGESHVVEVAQANCPSTFNSGTLTDFGPASFDGGVAVTGDRLVLPMQGSYDNVTFDSVPGYDNVDVIYMVFYDISANAISIKSLSEYTTADHTHPTIPIYTACDGDAYAIIYGRNNRDHLVKVPYFGANDEITVPGSEVFENTLITDADRVLMPYGYNATTTRVLNAKTGAIVSTISRGINEIVFANQLSQEGFITYYDSNDGDVYCKAAVSGITISGLEDFKLNTNLMPYYPTVDYEFDTRLSKVALIFDALYVAPATTAFINPNFVMFRSAGIYVPLSGEHRLNMPVTHTQYARDIKKVMRGYGASPYTMVYDPAVNYQVEISERSPVVLFGNTSYSGIVVSGIQTGYSQAQVLVSPTGGNNTFSRVTMNSNYSHVPDVRTETMMVESDDPEEPYYGKYLLIPVGNSAFPDLPTFTDLTAVDVTGLTNTPFAYTVSGLIAPGNSVVLATFPGYANHLETTKNPDFPYIFVSISGVPPTFWQKDGYYMGDAGGDFIDRTNNLPSYAINIIRVDDVL